MLEKERIYIESMTRIVDATNNLVVRCWRHELNRDYSQADNKREIAEVLSQEFPNCHDAAEAVLAIDRMNAVEILGTDGDGVVLYKDWP